MSGQPNYIELGVPDPDRALRFFTALLAWQPPPPAGPTQISTSTLNIGIHGADPSALFEVFFAVDDLDAALSTIPELGGSVSGPVHDSPGFGRWAECADDQGTRFGLRETI